MSAALPAQLDPWQAVGREAAFAGSLALVDLPRLREVLVGTALDAAAPAAFEIAFRRDEAGRPVVLGWVRAVLPLECQRCLGVVEHSVDAPIRLLLTQGPILGQDPPEPYEALPVIDDRVRPAELIEDELLLCVAADPDAPCGGVPDGGADPGRSWSRQERGGGRRSAKALCRPRWLEGRPLKSKLD